MKLDELLVALWDWGTPWLLVGLLGALIEYAWGFALSRSPVSEVRGRGYALMQEALGSFAAVGFFFFATSAVASAITLPSAQYPSQAMRTLQSAVQGYADWLSGLAALEKDLTLTFLLSPLTGVLTASAALARMTMQYLLYVSAALYAVLDLLWNKGVGKLMVAVGSGLLCVPRLRRLGPYLIFSALAATAVACAAAPALFSVVENPNFTYKPALWNPWDLRRVAEAVTGHVMNLIFEDGKNAAFTAVGVSLGIGIAAPVTAAASAAAGGVADSIVNRFRL
jgi:hypothetical protein